MPTASRNPIPHKLQAPRPNLYRQFFAPDECKLLDRAAEDDASSEINLLRVLLMRLLASAPRGSRLALKDHASLLAASSAAAIMMAGIVRFEDKYHNRLSRLQDSIMQALAVVDLADL